MKRTTSLPYVLLALLLTVASPSFAQGRCPHSPQPVPSAQQRQSMLPARILRCFLSDAEIALIRSSRYHDAQSTLSDPSFAGGELNPDGSVRPVLTAAQIAALTRMHEVLDPDMRAGANLRKFVPNSDVGGFLYGRTVIGAPGSEFVVTTDSVRGFVGLERNTQGLNAGEAIGALGLDYETTPLGQFTDASPIPLHRQVAVEVRRNGLHSIRHRMSAQGAIDAKIPMAKDLFDAVETNSASLDGRTTERNRSNQLDPYTGLGISDNLGLLTLSTRDAEDATYPLHLNEEDVMTVPTPLAVGDLFLRRGLDGRETLVAVYVRGRNPDGSFSDRWRLNPLLSPALRAYYRALIQAAADRVEAVGG